MRTPSLLAAALLAGACFSGSSPTSTEPPPPPKGRPDDKSAIITAKQFVRAISRNKQSEVRVMLASSVRVAGLELFDDPCRGKFDGEQTVTGDGLDVLAGCLLELGEDSVNPGSGTVMSDRGRWVVELEPTCASYKLELMERASGGLAVAAISARSKCGGVEGGEVGGEVGVAGDMGPPPPPPPPSLPKNVPPTSLESYRIAGTKMITPDDADKTRILDSGNQRVIGSFKLCLDVTGNVTQIRLLKSTGVPGYDAKLAREMAKWRYRPYMLDGRAVPVCTAITFVYSQSVAPPPP